MKRSDIARLSKELQGVLGWYGFDESIHIQRADRLQDVPEELVMIHESSHMAIAAATPYGQLQIMLGTVLSSANQTCIRNPIAECERIFAKSIENSFIVQESLATYVELLHWEMLLPERLDEAVADLPKSYRQAVRLLEETLLPIGSVGELHKLVWDVAVAIAKLSMSSADLVWVSDPRKLTLTNFGQYCQKDGPDIRFTKLCETIVQKHAAKEVLLEWSRRSAEAARKLGFGARKRGDFFIYDSETMLDRDQVVLQALPGFLGHLSDEYGSFRSVVVPTEVEQLINQIVGGWRSFFDSLGMSALFPLHKAVMGGPRDARKETRREYTIREPLAGHIMSGTAHIGTEQLLDRAELYFDKGERPVINLTEFESGSLGVLVFGVAESLVIALPELSSLKAETRLMPTRSQPSLAVLDIGEFRHFEFHRFRPGRKARRGEDQFLWHLPGEILQKYRFAAGVRGIEGTFLCSWPHFNFNHIRSVIDNQAESGWKMLVRFITFHETGFKSIVVHPLGVPHYTSWIGSERDVYALMDTYEGNKMVTIGAEDIAQKFGELQDSLIIHCLVDVAYLLDRLFSPEWFADSR